MLEEAAYALPGQTYKTSPAMLLFFLTVSIKDPTGDLEEPQDGKSLVL